MILPCSDDVHVLTLIHVALLVVTVVAFNAVRVMTTITLQPLGLVLTAPWRRSRR